MVVGGVWSMKWEAKRVEGGGNVVGSRWLSSQWFKPSSVVFFLAKIKESKGEEKWRYTLLSFVCSNEEASGSFYSSMQASMTSHEPCLKG